MSKYVNVNSSLFVGLLFLIHLMGFSYNAPQLASSMMLIVGIAGIAMVDFTGIVQQYIIVKRLVHDAFTLLVISRKEISIKGNAISMDGFSDEEVAAMDETERRTLTLIVNEMQVHVEMLCRMEEVYGRKIIGHSIHVACKRINPEIFPDNVSKMFQGHEGRLPAWSEQIISDMMEGARTYIDNIS